MPQNLYEILGVDETAEIEVIKAAHKALAKKYHPDTFVGNKKHAEEKLKAINSAFDVLSDAKKRKEYDEKLKSENSQTGFDDNNDFDTKGHGEPVLKADWKVLIEVFPEAEDMRKALMR
jgi:DnaJ-class molecular chaperone